MHAYNLQFVQILTSNVFILIFHFIFFFPVASSLQESAVYQGIILMLFTVPHEQGGNVFSLCWFLSFNEVIFLIFQLCV